MPEHILILPIMHVGSSVDLEEGAAEELRKYKAALRKYFRSKGKDCVFFERNIASRHMQIQVGFWACSCGRQRTVVASI